MSLCPAATYTNWTAIAVLGIGPMGEKTPFAGILRDSKRFGLLDEFWAQQHFGSSQQTRW
jgi:hypothetical protein